MPNVTSSLFDDPGDVVRRGSPGNRVDMLRRIPDAFRSEADRLNDGQIGVFDGVFPRGISEIEAKTPVKIRSRSHRRR
jgi:hypothetical protein